MDAELECYKTVNGQNWAAVHLGSDDGVHHNAGHRVDRRE